ncbi:MAG: TIGR01458 family HAD-type hydrolase [Solirubrobacterales bacterium]|nr:TIGR01458 family HAD-type hydrolase [Solirubrobacterales bacterium]
MSELPPKPDAVLLDVEGVLYIHGDVIDGAPEALARLREIAGGIRLVTNTSSISRKEVIARVRRAGLDVADEEVLTPAAMAVRYCREKGFSKVNLMVARSLREDLEEIDVVGTDQKADAIVLGDLGPMFSAETLSHAFRQMMDGAELIALQHNRYWKREDGLVLDVGAFSAALEYAAEKEAIVVGKPSKDFFRMALADVGAEAGRTVMVGDDIEGDIGGGLNAGIASVLVRTGKYQPERVAESGIEPTLTVDSIADLPEALG